MARPEWIDEALSEELPLLRDRGEGQYLEFMECYPNNGHELSREIAAFASSNTGTILIGVADDGSLTALDDVDTPEGRDRLCRRIEGVCSGNVRPAITPVVKFAQEGAAVVLAIEVARGHQPVYYSKNTPYVRHLSQSRPAEPHEVVERVSEWLARNSLESDTDDEGTRFLSSLAATLVQVLIDGGEFEKRNVNPWLENVRVQLGGAEKELRHLASEEIAVKDGLDGRLRRIADKLDSAASHRLTLGDTSWRTLSGYVADAVTEAAQLKIEYVDTVPLSADAKRDIDDMIKRSARELSDLDRRAQAMANDGRVRELQEEASRIGRQLLTASYYKKPQQDDGFVKQLREIGSGLHLIETERLYLDGGQSMQRVVEGVHDFSNRLEALFSSE